MENHTVIKSHLSLHQKINLFISFMLIIIFLILILSFGTLYFYMHNISKLLHISYTQSKLSDIFTQITTTMDSYGNDPGSIQPQQLFHLFESFDQTYSEIESGTELMNETSHALTHALECSYDSYRTQAKELFAGNQRQMDEQFFQKYYNTMEIGNYITLYMKQLIQETLKQGYLAYQTRRQTLNLILGAVFVIVTSITVLAILLSRMAFKQFIRPILKLSQATSVLADNSMDIPDIEVQSQDEIGKLIQTFNRMKHDCRQLLVTMQEKDELARLLYEEDLRRIDMENSVKNMRYSLLKQQINPHFLFNTLNLISQTAQREHAQLTGALIQRLSALFRYNLYNTADEVPISQELSVLRSYIYIQEVRFGDRYGFFIDCRIDPDTVMIPSFTLQPLVENAVKHGISPMKDGGVVRVKIVKKQNFLVITVTDNGKGMPRKALYEIRHGKKTMDNESGIGLQNVSSRLSILYPNSRFQIFSWQKLGTCVRIMIPMPPAKDED